MIPSKGSVSNITGAHKLIPREACRQTEARTSRQSRIVTDSRLRRFAMLSRLYRYIRVAPVRPMAFARMYARSAESVQSIVESPWPFRESAIDFSPVDGLSAPRSLKDRLAGLPPVPQSLPPSPGAKRLPGAFIRLQPNRRQTWRGGIARILDHSRC